MCLKKEFGAKKMLGLKEIFDPKEWSKKILGPKKFYVQKSFWSKQILVPIKF